MKKNTKLFALAAVAVAAALGVSAFAGCGYSSTGEAFALTHSDGQYVSRATVTVNKNGDITEATLVEVYTPIKFTADAADGEYTVEVNGTYYNTTITYNGVRLTYSADEGTYMCGTQTITEYFQDEANAKTYFEAVLSSNVSVVTSTGNDISVICNDTANKDENGYWTRQDAEDNDYSRWQANRDATLNYVIENDAAAFGTFTKSETAVTDSYGVDAYYWLDANNINTGATWTDMYITDSSRAATGYIQLLANAYVDAGFTL